MENCQSIDMQTGKNRKIEKAIESYTHVYMHADRCLLKKRFIF